MPEQPTHGTSFHTIDWVRLILAKGHRLRPALRTATPKCRRVPIYRHREIGAKSALEA